MSDHASNTTLTFPDLYKRPLLFMVRHWQGQGKLSTAFWRIAIGGEIAYILLFALLLIIIEPTGLVARVAMWGNLCGLLAYDIFSLVCVWRCGRRSTQVGWAFAARGYLVLQLVGTLQMVWQVA